MSYSTALSIRIFWLLAVINMCVGGMVGLERTVVPLLGEAAFGLTAGVAVAGFIVSFSLSKALFNLLAGILADRLGRKQVLLVGWLLGLPVPLLLIWAPTWGWVIAANVLLGINQALTWSMTVNMMIDIMPAQRRGFAAGINEFAGYLGVSTLAWLTGLVAAAYRLRPEPFYLGVLVSFVGLGLALLIPETMTKTRVAPLRWVRGVGVPSMLGTATNLKDGLVWLALPLLLAGRGLSVADIGLVGGVYPLVWAVGQPFFGPLSDRIGRRPLITAGMALQGSGLIVLMVLPTFLWALVAAVLLGLGTALAYPTLIASVADRVPAAERATALGIYRFFRDAGYALGAIIAGAGLGWLEPTIFIVSGGLLAGAGLAAYSLKPTST